MQLNKDNIDKLAFAIKKDFAKQLWVALKETMPEGAQKFANDEDGLRCMREALVKAEKVYHFEEAKEQGRFAFLTYVIGPNFDMEPFVNSILKEELWHPMDRLEHITGWVEVETEKAIKNNKGKK